MLCEHYEFVMICFLGATRSCRERYHEISQSCHAIGSQSNFIPQSALVPKVWPVADIQPIVPSHRSVPSECVKHEDCGSHQYCVNGRLAFSPGSRFELRGDDQYYLGVDITRNVCRPASLCCTNVDATGPRGETDMLYPCPNNSKCTSWAAKAFSCFHRNVFFAYCPRVDDKGFDFCIDASKQSCAADCEAGSILSGQKSGPKMCVRESIDRGPDGEYYAVITDAPTGFPKAPVINAATQFHISTSIALAICRFFL